MTERTWTSDLEADALLDEATVIHCAVLKELGTGIKKSFTPEDIHLLPEFIEENVDTFIGHNFIGYDLPLIKKITGYEFSGKVIDTLILSRTLRDLLKRQNRSLE